MVDALAAEYRLITGQEVTTAPQRRLLASCYGVHGPDTADQIEAWWRATGTVTNLLGLVRTTSEPPAPRGPEPDWSVLDAQPEPDDENGHDAGWPL
jgi:hypothetical protein